MKKYKLIKPWNDIVAGEFHDKLGEIIEMEDENRGSNLVRLGAFEEVKEEPVKEEKPSKPSKKGGKK